ncbi:Hypothetical predicted protein [Pelobates cultripes]|uniref:Reverse transcriptase domain-containing protein n=1 Tax=Pelobates cultripes TaxID=61616 RepID=A0AAD1R451_PELCU|nr:Hypothetical predicted protein [Pelobates cultripes]
MALMYANAYMYMYEIQDILAQFGQHIMVYYRYIDDLLVIWKGTQVEAHDMVE